VLIDASDIVRIAATWVGVRDPSHSHKVLLRLRRTEPSFVMSYLSALAMVGHELNPGAEYELEWLRLQQRRYRAAVATLRSRIPGIVELKGAVLATHYPDGVDRYSRDADISCHNLADLWEAVSILSAAGWNTSGLAVTWVRNEPQVTIELAGSEPAPLLPADRLELSMTASIGNALGVPPIRLCEVSSHDEDSLALALIAAEAFERRFGLRDAVDAALLWNVLVSRSSPPSEALHISRKHRLAPELARLLSLAANLTVERRSEVRVARMSVVACRVERIKSVVLQLVQPGAFARRLSQRRYLLGGHPLSEHVYKAIGRSVDADTARKNGMAMWGVPVDADPEFEGPELLRTPVGDYYLTTSPAIDEAMLNRVGMRLR
jgi:hypothetical protein